MAANSDGQRASAWLQAKSLPLAAVGAFVPALDLEGMVDATLRAGRSGEAAPEATLSLQGHGVRARPEGSEGSPAAELRIDAGLAAGRVQGSARVDGADGTRLALHGDAPVSRDDGAAAVAADLRWTGNVASVAAVLPVGDADVGGRMDADLHLSGSLAVPRLSGRASLAGGSPNNLWVNIFNWIIVIM